MKINNFFKLVISIVLPLLAGFVGSFFTMPAIEGWYTELVKPALNPPNWIFAPVWTTLYVLIGVSLFLVWKERSNILQNARTLRIWKLGITTFFVQLVLNTFWSIIFFGLQNPGLALLEIIILWLAIILNIILFAKISKLAAWLLVPYLLWVSFATYLNFAIWVLN